MATNVRRLYWLAWVNSKINRWIRVADAICGSIKVAANLLADIIQWVIIVPLFFTLAIIPFIPFLILHGIKWFIERLIKHGVKGLTKKQELKLGAAIRRVYRNKGK